MGRLDADELESVLRLARLALPPKQRKRLAKDLAALRASYGGLLAVSLPEGTPLLHAHGQLPLEGEATERRAHDRATPFPDARLALVDASAPQHRAGFFVVPAPRRPPAPGDGDHA
jgi:Asp-tRNA(Asn)/Glu-tRNA(Gln) amidotransferase C subunit